MAVRAAARGGPPPVPQLSLFGPPRPEEGASARCRFPGDGRRVPPPAPARSFFRSCAGPFRVPDRRSAGAPGAGPPPDPLFPPMCEWSADLEVGWACLLPFAFPAAAVLVLSASGLFATDVANSLLHFFDH